MRIVAGAETSNAASSETHDLISKILDAAKMSRHSSSSKWDQTASGTIRSNFKNALTAVCEIGVIARRDSFADLIYLSNASGFSALADDHQGPLCDPALIYMRKLIQDEIGFDPKADNLLEAVKSHAEENRFNPVVKWLDGLVWDGVERLSTWLPKVVGAADDPLNRAIGELLIKGMVARARYPGTKFDYCVVFEGPQGCGKSSLVRKLAEGPGEGYFTDAPGLVGMDNKERAELIGGKWVVELAELSGLARSEAEAVKAFLSQSFDRYRPPYGKVAIDRPRVCVFVGTTNASSYLSDSSGNRRFLPVPCTGVDLEQFDDLYTQILAEANHLLLTDCIKANASGISIVAGRSLPGVFSDRYLTLPIALRQLAEDMVEDRRHIDVFEESLRAVINGTHLSKTTLPDGREFISAGDIIAALQARLGRPPNVSGLAGHMKNFGWERHHSGPKKGRMRGYARDPLEP